MTGEGVSPLKVQGAILSPMDEYSEAVKDGSPILRLFPGHGF